MLNIGRIGGVVLLWIKRNTGEPSRREILKLHKRTRINHFSRLRRQCKKVGMQLHLDWINKSWNSSLTQAKHTLALPTTPCTLTRLSFIYVHYRHKSMQRVSSSFALYELNYQTDSNSMSMEGKHYKVYKVHNWTLAFKSNLININVAPFPQRYLDEKKNTQPCISVHFNSFSIIFYF